jgi:acetolactate synthase-1/2/3 large subunit
MTGAESMMRAAHTAGIEVCFANPGTTEIPLVVAMDGQEGLRPVLCLFEGVCTGAADGYARMSGRPAMVLLHLGPGLAGGIPNLHNARRARTPMVVVVGEHATWHRSLDPPLAMDIQALTSTVSGWQRTCTSAGRLGSDMLQAVEAARKGQVATLVVPFDLQAEETGAMVVSAQRSAPDDCDGAVVERAARIMSSGQRTALVLGGRALTREAQLAAARIRHACGCDLLAETFPARMEHGAGLPEIFRIPYLPEMSLELLKPYGSFVFAGADEPVAFFGYRGGPGRLVRDDQERVHIAALHQDPGPVLHRLADALGAPGMPREDLLARPNRPAIPAGALTGEKACAVVAALQPEGAVVVDESITNSIWYYPITSGLPPFTLLTLTGGSLGQGPACAAGAAVACPDRPVINLQADGAAMYTVQALWTQAREGLNVTTLVFANRRYDILRFELARFGVASPGPAADRLTDLSGIDWVGLGASMGVDSCAVHTTVDLVSALERSLAESGPHLIRIDL